MSTLRFVHPQDLSSIQCFLITSSAWSNSTFFQLTLTEDTFHVTAGRDITDQVNVVQSVSEYLFPLSFIQRATPEVRRQRLLRLQRAECPFASRLGAERPFHPRMLFLSLFPQFRFPTVLLLGVPATIPPLSTSRIDDHMTPYTSDLIAMKRSIAANQHRADPFRCLVDVDALLPPPPAGPSDDASEWYVETVEDGIDQALFPRTMGYLVLESQYRQ